MWITLEICSNLPVLHLQASTIKISIIDNESIEVQTFGVFQKLICIIILGKHKHIGHYLKQVASLQFYNYYNLR